jgi:hypothetical protein
MLPRLDAVLLYYLTASLGRVALVLIKQAPNATCVRRTLANANTGIC